MRIGYLINRYPAVSHSFIRREILALERQGYEVLRISVRGWDEPIHGEEDRLERARTRYVLQGGPVPLLLALMRITLKSPLRFLESLKLTWRVSRRSDRSLALHMIYLLEACQVALWLQADGAEHLHAHFGTNSAEVAMFSHELGGPKWSFTAHGPEEFDKPEFLALPEKIRRSSFVVGVSSFGRSQLFRHTAHQDWQKVKVVHCGIEPAFYQMAPDENHYPQRLICVGRLCEQKGQLLLLQATQLLAERGTKFELVLAGDGEMRGELGDAFISEHKLKDVVRITGWIGSDQVRDELLSARALVLPSFAEGLPVVIMEAMALKRPVLSTYVAGIPELVVSSKHGWLVPAGDVKALAAAMQTCLETSQEAIASMGETAHLRVLQRHDIDSEVGKLIEFINGS